MAKKLSDRALLILMAIRDACNWPVCDRAWLPGRARGLDDYVEEMERYVNISGGGDAAILRALAKAGLIERPRPAPGSTDLPTRYYFRITEDGVLAIEHARAAGRLQPWLDERDRRALKDRADDADARRALS